MRTKLNKRCPSQGKKWKTKDWKKKREGHMINCLLTTKLGRAGPENIWLLVIAYGPRCAGSVRTPWPRAKYFPVRPSHSPNKYISLETQMQILQLLLPRPQRLEGETANQREGIQTRAAHAQSCNLTIWKLSWIILWEKSLMQTSESSRYVKSKAVNLIVI